MNSEKNPGSRDSEDSEPKADEGRGAAEEWVPLSVRNARKMRKDLWPYIWMSFASIIILVVAFAIVSYRVGAQSCH